jgi:hypothetical protein
LQLLLLPMTQPLQLQLMPMLLTMKKATVQAMQNMPAMGGVFSGQQQQQRNGLSRRRQHLQQMQHQASLPFAAAEVPASTGEWWHAALTD